MARFGLLGWIGAGLFATLLLTYAGRAPVVGAATGMPPASRGLDQADACCSGAVQPGPATAPAGDATASATPACTPGWERVALADAGGNFSVGALAAVSTQDIWAVGAGSTKNGPDHTVTEHWDGSTWRVVPSPNDGDLPNRLYAVAARASDDVWAVGEVAGTPSRPLALHWDGLGWTVVPVPAAGAGDNPFHGVAVAGPGDVWAVGGSQAPLVAHWDGGAWQVITGLPAGTGVLRGVAAAGPRNVWAAGDNATSLHWDGAAWRRIPTADPDDQLRAVTVLAPDDVWAVGRIYNMALSEHWNGYRWRLVGFPSPSCYTQALNAIAAASPADIWAVGYQEINNYGVENTLLGHWIGQGWSQEYDTGLDWVSLSGVVCPAPGIAWATGGYFVERYRNVCSPPGTAGPTATPAASPPPASPTASPVPTDCGPQWGYVPVPQGEGTYLQVEGLVAFRSNDVWVVGSGIDCHLQYNGFTYVQRWTGTGWQGVYGAASSYGINWNGIAGLDDNNVWVTGIMYDPARQLQTALRHWDGRSWKVFDTQALSATVISGVGRAGHRDIWLVGQYSTDGSHLLPIAYRATGDRLVRVPIAAFPGARETRLLAVSGASTLDAWVVGYALFAPPRADQPVMEHWDGQNWQVVPIPPVSTGSSRLESVVAIDTNDVWAAGGIGTTCLALHWDGSAWRNVSCPGWNIDALAAYATNDVWGNGVELKHWDGHAWSIVHGWHAASGGPDTAGSAPAAGGAVLSGLDVVGPDELWANAGAVLHYVDPCRSPPARCPVTFSDVPPSSPFYAPVSCLACRGVLSGYADGTYRPSVAVTRGQTARLVMAAAGYADPIPAAQQTFADVPPGQTFWLPVERLAAHRVASGYACGEPGEPCDRGHRPYFRPAGALTRAEAAKLVANARGFADRSPPTQQTFRDVGPAHPLWRDVERAAAHGVVSGYADDTYRPSALLTRGQIARLLANAFFPACALSTP